MKNQTNTEEHQIAVKTSTTSVVPRKHSDQENIVVRTVNNRQRQAEPVQTRQSKQTVQNNVPYTTHRKATNAKANSKNTKYATQAKQTDSTDTMAFTKTRQKCKNRQTRKEKIDNAENTEKNKALQRYPS